MFVFPGHNRTNNDALIDSNLSVSQLDNINSQKEVKLLLLGEETGEETVEGTGEETLEGTGEETVEETGE